MCCSGPWVPVPKSQCTWLPGEAGQGFPCMCHVAILDLISLELRTATVPAMEAEPIANKRWKTW